MGMFECLCEDNFNFSCYLIINSLHVTSSIIIVSSFMSVSAVKMFKLFTLYGSSSAQAQKTPYENNHHTKCLFVSQQAVCYLREGSSLSSKVAPVHIIKAYGGRGSGIVQLFLTSAHGGEE